MHQHSEFYDLFSGYFWLIFPIGVGIIVMLGTWLNHRRALSALEAIQAYATQGKEPPPELLALIQPKRREHNPTERARNMTLVGFILLAMSASFVVMAAFMGGDMQQRGGMYFVVVMFAGVAVAFFITAWTTRRDAARDTGHDTGRADHR